MKIILSICAMALGAVALLANANVAIVIKGKTLDSRTSSAIERGGSVLVPLRAVSEGLGAQVQFLSGVIMIGRAPDLISLKLGTREAVVNGSPRTMSVAPVSYAGTTYVPLRFIGEALGESVKFDALSRVVTIGIDQELQTPNDVQPPKEAEPVEERPIDLPRVPKAAIIPWNLKDCTDGGREVARESIIKLVEDRGFQIIDEGTVRVACQSVLGFSDTDAPGRTMPSPQQLLQIGRLLGVDTVISGSMRWRTRGVFVFPRGMVTKAYTSAAVRVVDVNSESLVHDVAEVKADSENRSDFDMYASWLLIGLPNPFGRPKDPAHRRAGAIAVGKVLDGWQPKKPTKIN